MDGIKELFQLADRLASAAQAAEQEEIAKPLAALEAAADEVKRSFSGSWLGYHSRVYYKDLAPAPPGANFSQEWGLKEMLSSMGSRGEWREFDAEDVQQYVREKAGSPDLGPARDAAESATRVFRSAKADILSILQHEIEDRSNDFLESLKTELESLELVSIADVTQRWAPTGAVISRDMLAIGQGTKVPPHIRVLAEIASIRHSFHTCETASEISRKAGSHMERRKRKRVAAERIGTNVFIGHGRSAAWRELKDFVRERLRLPWDEFNRVPVAGVTNIARLSEMLDAAAIALLVMTAEDEMAHGAIQARMNVVHEAGLFQGRLGFTKAIVLLEEGCSEFSNIQGLGQIRFPAGKISAAFEEIRRVLEREGLIPESSTGCSNPTTSPINSPEAASAVGSFLPSRSKSVPHLSHLVKLTPPDLSSQFVHIDLSEPRLAVVLMGGTPAKRANTSNGRSGSGCLRVPVQRRRKALSQNRRRKSSEH